MYFPFYWKWVPHFIAVTGITRPYLTHGCNLVQFIYIYGHIHSKLAVYLLTGGPLNMCAVSRHFCGLLAGPQQVPTGGPSSFIYHPQAACRAAGEGRRQLFHNHRSTGTGLPQPTTLDLMIKAWGGVSSQLITWSSNTWLVLGIPRQYYVHCTSGHNT